MTTKPRCRAKDPATCKTHGTPKTAAAVPALDALDEIGARRAQSTAARVTARAGRKQMLEDLRMNVNAGNVTVIDGRTYVGRPIPLAAANVDRLTYELQKAAQYGVETYGTDDPIESVNAAWQDLVDTYDVSFTEESVVIRDNEQVLRNALLERVHAAAY